MSGVVLAGGASRRMGTEKAFVTIDGETFLQRAIGRLRRAGAAPVVVATGTAGRLGPLPEADGEVADDPRHRGEGPLAGLLAALDASPREHVAVLAVDLVDASPELLRWLREQWRPADIALLPLDAAGRPQPLHAVVGRAAAPAIASALAAGERRVLRVLDAAGARVLEPPPPLADAALRWSTNRNAPRPGEASAPPAPTASPPTGGEDAAGLRRARPLRPAVTGYVRHVTNTSDFEANEADVLEQQAPIEDRPARDTRRLDDPLVEADEADLLEQGQSVPADPEQS